ncbi:cation channel sperm-associated protein subunit gamma-like [Dromiciops gliroides]|uniref:cation channel sperm-associated protein subunit gamma-like n=1 Tax=Dromiciops gliroides TaxID=33562 RepID=UPI001CC710B6|nr:cation channel sperm-associated protein subunit gamma-like [Dromiciops gliroides]
MDCGRARGRSRCSSASPDASHDSLPGLPSSGLPTLMLSLLLLLLLLLLPRPILPQLEDNCRWQVALNLYETLGEHSEKFFSREAKPVDHFFDKLVDSPIDYKENYLGFPYFMKINFSCPGEAKEAFVRGGHFKGLFPIVLVTFHTPVNFRRWKAERLQIEMEGAPFQTKKECPEDDICFLSWYTPMPTKNGSVVMAVDISSNKIGEIIGNARYMININGFLKPEKDKVIFTLGNEVRGIAHRDFINTSSRPLWATVSQAPVLILGGIPNEKMVLLSDSSFKDISLVELNIDSCWLGSLECPQEHFTASIFDTISTESTLFIRQNQLVYYFTGNYSHLPGKANSNWVQVLHKRCIKKLCPVEFPSNGSEYVLALAGGNEEGIFFFGTITDGTVTFKALPASSSICDVLKAPKCYLHWVVYNTDDYTFLLLMELGKGNQMEFALFKYTQDAKGTNEYNVTLLYKIPHFVPTSGAKHFLMLVGMEEYTDCPMVPRGLFYNPFSQLLYIYGNAILQSFDHRNFVYMTAFPKESSIKYMTSSYRGEAIGVTETEEIWFLLEGSFRVYRLYPSRAWNIVFSLSQLLHLNTYSTNETSVSVFYDSFGLEQLVYLVDENGKGRLVKRRLPVSRLLLLLRLNRTPVKITYKLPVPSLLYSNPCPFEEVHLRNLPKPQKYTRVERYRAEPPSVSSEAGFHTKISLAIYQGLVYRLLWLHAMYNKPYADPVHDPTWRWWKDKMQHKAFYFYTSSNFLSVYGIRIDMEGYDKLYDLNAENRLPEFLFLDKGTQYSFSVYLVLPKMSWKNNFLGKKKHLRLAVVISHPLCVSATVTNDYLVNRNAILFQVVIQDKSQCFGQSISGHNLKKTSIILKVVGSAGRCFAKTRIGHRTKGNAMIPMFIGCPPGKRLAFDITLTIQHNKKANKRYFDCVYPDPEMPCFFFGDPFFPFFLVQDMVTGESGSFNGSYVLKVIGGGTSLENIVDYSEADIFRYNSPNDTTKSLIWINRDNWTDSHSFSILQYNSSGIEWLCLRNSPCYDIIPYSFFSPEFFFKIMVSNRGVDTSTYCDYQLIFILHIHGLPLSGRRAISYLKKTAYVCLGIIFAYILFCTLWPRVKAAWTSIKSKFTDLLTTESFYTYSTSASTLHSMVSSRMSTADRQSLRKSRFKKKS